MLLALRSLWEAASSSGNAYLSSARCSARAGRITGNVETSGGALPNWQLIHNLQEAERLSRGDAQLRSARTRARASRIIAIGASFVALVPSAVRVRPRRANGTFAKMDVRHRTRTLAKAHRILARGMQLAIAQNAHAIARAGLTVRAEGAAHIQISSANIVAFSSAPHAKGARNFTDDEIIALLLAA